MHPVFRLVKHHARRRLKHFVSHFHAAVQAVIGDHLFAQRGLVVMERWQAVEELDLRIAGQRQHRTVNLIIAEQGDTFGPFFLRLAHRYPDVGIDKIGAFHPRGDIFRQGDVATLLFGQCGTGLHQLRLRPAGRWRYQAQIQTGQRCGFQHRIAHVVARVAGVDQRHLVKGFARQVLFHGQQVRQQLGGVELVGEAVPHRHAGVLRQGLHHLLAVAAILNAIVHPPEHAGGVFDRLFMANLAAAWPQIGHAGALIVCGNFERASCTG